MPEPEHVTSSRIAYDHSADQFVKFVGTELSEDFEAPQDRTVLRSFVQQVQSRVSADASAESSGLVLDIGCGPGRVAAELWRSGLTVLGIDISAQMIAAAQHAHPELAFEVGTLTQLPVPDQSVVGAVYWYSIITTPLSELAEVWRELDRVLIGGGPVLIAFQAGSNIEDVRPKAYGSDTTLTLYHHGVDEVTDSLAGAGFEVDTMIQRPAELPHENTPQAFLLAQRTPI